MKCLNRFKLIAVIAAAALPLLCSSPAAVAQTFGQVVDLPFVNKPPFTNALSGIGGLHRTNVLSQFTNGSTTVTSAPVALRGQGFALELDISPTNALLTNIVNEFRFSMDGTNWLADPTLLWRAGGSAIAAGKFNRGTNLIEDVFRNFPFIQHWKIHLTNGVDNVGSAFSTNGPPVRIVTGFSPR